MSQDRPTSASQHTIQGLTELPSSSSSSVSLKRRASSSFDCADDSASRKKMKDSEEEQEREEDTARDPMDVAVTESNTNFIDDLTQELQCGCCSELVYKPLLVMPCQHFFCGSCCVLWIRNGGTNCPACRSLATVAMPFRALQSVIDSLLRAAPHKARTEREREQADEIYKSGHSIRIPPPREVSPPPDVERSADYVHPCPHCAANNVYDWRCPQPVPDPATDPDNAWHVDDGVPPGHAHCGNCENLLAMRAPSTTRCDLCMVSFCGIGVQDRCVALPIMSQHPHNISTHADLIQCADLYECFDGNTVEVEIMLEYLNTQRLTPRHIYREIVQHIQKQPRGFSPLVELELFVDVHGVAPSAEVNADAPKSRACRLCAAEVFLWGLKDWWFRERQKGFLEEDITKRPDCPEGSSCAKQKDDNAHAREFNHIITPHLPEEPEAAPNPIPEVPDVTENSSAPSSPAPQRTPTPPLPSVTPPNPPPALAPSSSTISRSFLLNVDSAGPPTPPDFHIPDTDMRDAIDMQT